MKKKKTALHVEKKEDDKAAEIARAKQAIENTPKVHVLAGLPQYLKDPEVYPKIQKALLETIATTHSHSDLLEWGGCVPCQIKMHNHGEMMRKLGFQSPQQYRAWCKVHEKIEKRVKLR